MISEFELSLFTVDFDFQRQDLNDVEAIREQKDYCLSAPEYLLSGSTKALNVRPDLAPKGFTGLVFRE